MSVTVKLIVLSSLLALGSCQSQESGWNEDKANMIGTKYTDLLLCAGPPEAEVTVSREVGIVSYSAHDEIDIGYGPSSRECKVNITITDGKISAVNEKVGYFVMCPGSFEHCPWHKDRLMF